MKIQLTQKNTRLQEFQRCYPDRKYEWCAYIEKKPQCFVVGKTEQGTLGRMVLVFGKENGLWDVSLLDQPSLEQLVGYMFLTPASTLKINGRSAYLCIR